MLTKPQSTKLNQTQNLYIHHYFTTHLFNIFSILTQKY